MLYFISAEDKNLDQHNNYERSLLLKKQLNAFKFPNHSCEMIVKGKKYQAFFCKADFNSLMQLANDFGQKFVVSIDSKGKASRIDLECIEINRMGSLVEVSKTKAFTHNVYIMLKDKYYVME